MPPTVNRQSSTTSLQPRSSYIIGFLISTIKSVKYPPDHQHISAVFNAQLSAMLVSDRLRWAVVNGNLPIVKRLLRRFPDMLENTDPANGWTSLHLAGYHGHYLVCVLLIQLGHDYGEISLDHERNTPLHLAARENHEQTVHYLAQHMTRCLDWRNSADETALMVAARHGNDPCINLLLDFGADIDLADRNGNRPIHIAAAFGHLKTLRTLIGRNADIQCQNKEGWRPVQYCSTYQVQDYLQSLIHDKSEAKKKLALYKPGASSSSTNLISSASTHLSRQPVSSLATSNSTTLLSTASTVLTCSPTSISTTVVASPLLLPPINHANQQHHASPSPSPSSYSGLGQYTPVQATPVTSSASSVVSSPGSPALASPATVDFPLISRPLDSSNSQGPPVPPKHPSPSRLSGPSSSSPLTPYTPPAGSNGSPHRAAGQTSSSSHESPITASPRSRSSSRRTGNKENANSSLAPPPPPLFVPPRKTSLTKSISQGWLSSPSQTSLSSSSSVTTETTLQTQTQASLHTSHSSSPATSIASTSTIQQAFFPTGQSTNNSNQSVTAPSLPMPNFGHAFRPPSSISVNSASTTSNNSSANPSVTSLNSPVTPTTAVPLGSADSTPHTLDPQIRTSPYSSVARSRVLDVSVSNVGRNYTRADYRFI